MDGYRHRIMDSLLEKKLQAKGAVLIEGATDSMDLLKSNLEATSRTHIGSLTRGNKKGAIF